ncbi:hypothetical protein FGIG_09117 [Fasciola gigantica]|uniref:Uncharacterized protein n=1 Tax=Fasciola gigantica TaxID=46835 RepID=A0A504YZ39_FASGI|nr:hypothetical protein FGIG_09117 [Fasciola gigantica]
MFDDSEDGRLDSEKEQAGDIPKTVGVHFDKEYTSEDSVLQTEDSTPVDEITRLSRLSQMDLNVGFPGSYSTQLMRLTAEIAQQQEEQEIEQSWRTLKKHDNLRRKSMTLLSKAAKSEPLLPLSNVVRNVLHELQLVWIMFQCIAVIALFSKLNWEGKLRGPIAQVPNYSAKRMPLIPTQDQMHKRLLVYLVLLVFVYIPTAGLHFAYVLDDVPDETPLQLVRKAIYAQTNRISVRRSRRWSTDPRFDQFRRPRRRQWLTTLVLLFSMILFFYGVSLLCVDCSYLIGIRIWRRIINEWIGQLQHQYYSNRPTRNTRADPIRVLDTIHIMFQCCGRSGMQAYRDWWSSEIPKPTDDWFPRQKDQLDPELVLDANTTRLTPFSCCKWGLRGTGCDHVHATDPEQFYQRGCQEPIVDLLLRQWMNAVTSCIVPVILLTIPQMVLYLSIIQPREAIRQMQRTAIELQLMFTFWRELDSQVNEKTRQISQLQGKQLVEKHEEKVRSAQTRINGAGRYTKDQTRQRGDSIDMTRSEDGSLESVTGSPESGENNSDSSGGIPMDESIKWSNASSGEMETSAANFHPLARNYRGVQSLQK